MDISLDLISYLWKKIEKQYKVAFFGGFAIGIITHLYTLTNKLTNWEELSIGGVGGGLAYGSWLSEFFNWWFSRWANPGVNGVSMIFFISLAAAFVVSILRIKSTTGAFLVGALMVTFPSVASTMTYMFVAPIYGLALFFMTLGVWMTVKFKFGWICGIVLEMVSMATYQTYFAFAVCLFVLALIVDVCQGRKEQNIVLDGFKYLGTLGAGMAAYLISLKVLDVPIADYRGMQDIGGASPVEYATAVLRAYHRVLEFFVIRPDSFEQGAAHMFNVICAIILVVLLVTVFLQKATGRSILSLVMYVVFTLLMPLSIGLVYVMSVETQHASAVMIYSYVAFYIWIVVMAEQLSAHNIYAHVIAFSAAIILLIVTFSNYRITSNGYYRAFIANQRIYSLYTRIVDRIEGQEGYQYGDQIYIAGSFEKDVFPLDTYKQDEWIYADLDGITTEATLFMEPTRQFYMRLFMGSENPYMSLGDEEMTKVKESVTYQDMPAWPAEGCVQKINGIWTIKMVEETAN